MRSHYREYLTIRNLLANAYWRFSIFFYYIRAGTVADTHIVVAQRAHDSSSFVVGVLAAARGTVQEAVLIRVAGGAATIRVRTGLTGRRAAYWFS